MQGGGVSVEYGYDALNRLVQETKKQESSSKKQEAKVKYDHQYSYDAVGNRVELIKHKGGGRRQADQRNLRLRCRESSAWSDTG